MYLNAGDLTPAGRTPTILIVEDTDWIRSGMKQAAERCGYLVAEAKDESEAVAVAQQQAPDLVVTEERLPDFENLCTSVREHPAFHHVAIVIVDPDATEGTRKGHAFVVKDFESLAPLLPPRDRN